MGSYGIESFENDDAWEWFAEFKKKGVPSMKEIFKKVAKVSEKEYLELFEGSSVIAAADILRAKGKMMRNEKLPDNEFTEWLTAHPKWHPSSKLRDSALKAIDRVLGENSEIKELWEEESVDPNDGQRWRQEVDRIRHDLSLMEFPNEAVAMWRMYEWYDRLLLCYLPLSIIMYIFMDIKDFFPEYRIYVKLTAFAIIAYFSMERFKNIS